MTNEEAIRDIEENIIPVVGGKSLRIACNALRAQEKEPNIGRKYALTTGLCPMCEDCPAGCPILAPNDSRNAQEKEPCECGCDVCNRNFSGNGLMRVREGTYLVLREIRDIVDAKYCPMCGRPLKGEGNGTAD